MKLTECGKWVHVICSLFMVGVSFSNASTMEPINISKVPASNRKKTCSFCNTSKGYCTTCAAKKCNVHFHITCAQNEKTLKEEATKNNKIAFSAYCKEHNPTSSRRLSSGSVADRKREKTFTSDTPGKDGVRILRSINNESTPLAQRKRLCK